MVYRRGGVAQTFSARKRHLRPGRLAVALTAMGAVLTLGTTLGAAAVHQSNTSAQVQAAKSLVNQYYTPHVWAIPTSGPKTVPGKNIWWISCGQNSPNCAIGASAAVKAGAAAGWKVTVFDGDFGLNDAYDKGIRQAIAAKASGIVLEDVECDAVKQSMVNAAAAHIPVLNIGGAPCTGAANLQYNFKYVPGYVTVAAQNGLYGKLIGDYEVAHFNGKAHVLYYNIVGNQGSDQTFAAMKSVLGQCSACSLKEINVPLQNLGPQLSSQVQSDLEANPSANAVAMPFASVFDAGFGPGLVHSRRHLLVISPGQSVAFYNSMRTDKSTLTLVSLNTGSQYQAWAAMDDMNRVLHGQPVAPQGGYVLFSDLTHNLPASGEDFDPWAKQFFASKFPYQSVYKKVWKG